MNQKHTVPLHTLVDELDLIVCHPSSEYEKILLGNQDVNRPALQFAGFYDYFDPDRVQIVGKVEMTYLASLSPERRREAISTLFERHPVAIILAHHMDPSEEFMEAAQKYNIPLLRSALNTSELLAQVVIQLRQHLAPRITMHGVLMEIHGEGVLITGDSGIGKSETAMALLKRGHRLIADDAVEIKRISHNSLIGSAPELIRYFMELRGIGVIDARHIFGIGAVKPEQYIDLVVHFELWDDKKAYDRLGLDPEYTEILDVKLPYNCIPVRPGRNLGAILELAAMNNREKKMGYNAARALVERHDKMLLEGEF
ncbi:MAG: HPr(Ser) kinase/phosphatase [Eubacteriales bacterium]|nr:HPr(Ser) kinase/phosphatase [Eubacteriales bacterium]